MIIKIKSLGLLCDKLPHSIEIPVGGNLKTFKDILMEMTDHQTSSKLDNAVYIVNKVKADNETALKDGDEVMILTVLGGG